MKDFIVPVVAIIVIGIIECVALCNGIDGIMLTSSCTLIGGIAGYKIPNIGKQNRQKSDP